MGELANTTSSSSSFVSTFSSSASSAFPKPKMAEFSSAEDSKIWPPEIEYLFICTLVKEQARGIIVNGKMKKNHWQVVIDHFCQEANKHYDHSQISQKFKRLKRKYRAFSRLIGMKGMTWDRDTNIVTGSDKAWSDAELQPKREAANALKHFIGGGGGGMKRKAVDAMADAQMIEAQMSRKTQSGKDYDSHKTIESDDPYSVSAVTNILNSMDSLTDQTFCNALQKLEKLENRQFLVTMDPKRRPSWIEHLARSS
ncbi:hypothetical protein SO802_024937 [Lithocarpus litseifolius]|uniref:Myb/SANT-like domain-containing protein n=1 Tax=Lithocarpus litseifolius TaxID=425828 RepID=A0AAW2BVT3_9ROSI